MSHSAKRREEIRLYKRVERHIRNLKELNLRAQPKCELHSLGSPCEGSLRYFQFSDAYVCEAHDHQMHAAPEAP